MKEVVHHNNFNLIRLIGAFLVIISHSFGLLNKGEIQPIFKLNGSKLILSDLGLYAFFTISGYLIYKSLINSPSYLNFLWKRFLRIVPGLALVNLFTIILGLIVTNLPASQYLFNVQTWQYLIINTSLLSNQYFLPGVFTNNPDQSVNASIWSILLEVKFYIILMLSQMAGLMHTRWMVLIFFIVVQITGLYITLNNISIPDINLDIYITFGGYFLIGVVFAQFPEFLKIHWLIPAGILLIALFLQSNYSPLLITVSLPFFVLKAGFLKPILGVHKADYSYGLYIYAYPIQQTIITIFGDQISVISHILLSTAFSFGFAMQSWHFLEEPCLSKKDKIKYLI